MKNVLIWLHYYSITLYISLFNHTWCMCGCYICFVHECCLYIFLMASHTPSILGRCGKLADATDDFLIKLQSGNTEKTQLYFLKVEVVNAYGLLDFSFYYYLQIPYIIWSYIFLLLALSGWCSKIHAKTLKNVEICIEFKKQYSFPFFLSAAKCSNCCLLFLCDSGNKCDLKRKVMLI